ncbi:MAG: hypothetical protein HW388_523 [Dehalococcoidia bacterium]|nr:hypothetical protein [Dehalococcoidia bacterium]
MQHRYSRWDDTQSSDAPSPEELMEHMAQEIWRGQDLSSLLRRMLQRGAQLPQGQRMMGLQELLKRLRGARDSHLQQHNLASVFDDIQERLERVLETERAGIQSRLDEMDRASSPQDMPTSQESRDGVDPSMEDLFRRMAQSHLEQLDRLPPGAGGRIKELRDYDFLDPEARQQFEELLKTLQQQVLQSYFQNLEQGIQNMTPEALRQTQQMVHDLNQLFQQRLQGQNPDISSFMAKWGQAFPEGIETFDELAEHLERQMAQMESLLNSMPTEMRRQLDEMMQALLRDNRLQVDLMQLAANLEKLFPDRRRHSPFSLSGDEPITLQEALKLMGDLNSLETLEREVREAMRSNDASRLDPDEVGRLLAGFIRRKGDDWELTPFAIRKIGERALKEIFSKLGRRSAGEHSLEQSGMGVEPLEETKRYVFGDPLHLDSLKTVKNAVLREGPGTPVHLRPEDFEVNRTTILTKCSTVIALDMSYSMIGAGYFQIGQRVSLALDTLIRTRYPKDKVFVTAFSYFVLPLKPSMLLDTHWVEYGGGTNLQEMLRQARKMLAGEGGTKQIILVTDAQPTTHNGWWGDDTTWRGHRRGAGVLEETLQEVARCTREHITINTFMMGRDPALLNFVRLMTKMNRGRAFLVTPERLGEYVLLDYVKMRNRVLH